MSFERAFLLRRLRELETRAGPPGRLVVAFSGGLDSSALLHALATSRDEHKHRLVAVHIDHRLQAESAEWARHCEAFARARDVEFECQAVSVDPATGRGPEASARAARYGALRICIGKGDWLVSAHHRDDQAETLLLNLMRGSGPAGLAGIVPVRRFAAGWLVRPLLDVSREDLEAYVVANNIDYIDDPSNADTKFDRNFLRHDVLALLESRWPDAAGRIRRSAALLAEARDLLAELADIDSRLVVGDDGKLSIPKLVKLTEARQRNLLRHALASLDLPLPGAAQLEQIVRQVVPAREDAQPAVAWPGAMARRYRDTLYLMSDRVEDALPTGAQPVHGDRITLPAGLGTLVLRRGTGMGLSDAVIDRGLELRYREGGEEFKPVFQRHTRKLKKILQEEGIVPWMRERLPLLYSDGKLVAVADLWIAADAAAEPGTTIEWQGRPALH